MNNLNKSKQKINSNGQLWPTEKYYQQLEQLHKIVNQAVYIIPLHQSQTSLTFSISSKPVNLIAIVDYPLPDPENHIYPHMLIFDDGTGLNLGRILQVSINTAFNPDKEDIIYCDNKMQQTLMFSERRLNKESIRLASQYGLAEVLGLSQNDINKVIKGTKTHQKSIT